MAGALYTRYFVILVLLVGAGGCGLSKNARIPVVGTGKTEKFSIQIDVSQGANQNSPLPVDFVVVADKKLMPEIAKLSAKDWFERRVQIQRDLPDKVQVLSWEWVPGQHTGPISIDVAPKARGGFIFANYLNGGEHRGYVDLRSPVVATFGPEDFSLQVLK